MIQDEMIDEMQELRLAGYAVGETYEELKTRHKKVPTIKTVRKHCRMGCAPDDNHAGVRKQMAFDAEPLKPAVVEIVERNPECHMSSAYDVLVERFVESGECDALPGNEQTLRNYIRHLRAPRRSSRPRPPRAARSA